MSHDLQEIAHIARLAMLAMCVRGVAECEFETSAEVHEVRVTASRPVAGSQTIDVNVEFFGTHAVPLGGISL